MKDRPVAMSAHTDTATGRHIHSPLCHLLAPEEHTPPGSVPLRIGARHGALGEVRLPRSHFSVVFTCMSAVAWASVGSWAERAA